MTKISGANHLWSKRQMIEQKLASGSLWICRQPKWYFYSLGRSNYSPVRTEHKRQIKYVQQNSYITDAYKLTTEFKITQNDPLTLIGSITNIYSFQYKSMEIIEMRSEFVYKFVEDWEKITWCL